MSVVPVLRHDWFSSYRDPPTPLSSGAHLPRRGRTPENRDTRISGRKKGPTSPLRRGLSSYSYSPEMRGVHPSSGPPDPRPIPHRRRTSPTTNPLDSTLSLPSYSLVVSPSASTDLGGQWGPNRSSENLPPPRAPSVDTGLTEKPPDAVSTRPEVNFYLFP